MSWRKEHRRAERGYHHGNLKEALLQAALGLIAEKGAAGFTFADAPRMAGVAGHAAAAGDDDGPAYLVDVARRGVAVRAWRCGTPEAADVAGGSAGSAGADLSARSRFPD